MTFSRRTFVAAATGVVGSLAGCSGGSGGGGGEDTETETPTPTDTPTETPTPTATPTPTPSGPPEDAPVATVGLSNKTFHPMELEIEPGTVVEWVNNGMGRHQLEDADFHDGYAKSWKMDEELVSEPVTHYFPEPGIYEVKCSLDYGHIGGCSVVVVGDNTYEKELPCSPQ